MFDWFWHHYYYFQQIDIPPSEPTGLEGIIFFLGLMLPGCLAVYMVYKNRTKYHDLLHQPFTEAPGPVRLETPILFYALLAAGVAIMILPSESYARLLQRKFTGSWPFWTCMSILVLGCLASTLQYILVFLMFSEVRLSLALGLLLWIPLGALLFVYVAQTGFFYAEISRGVLSGFMKPEAAFDWVLKLHRFSLLVFLPPYFLFARERRAVLQLVGWNLMFLLPKKLRFKFGGGASGGGGANAKI